MHRYIAIAILLLVSACACTSSIHRRLMVLDYADFGPQVIAREIIGMEWWQWQRSGDPDPWEYPIKVVVYKDLPEEKVKRAFPVDPEKQLDYRYVEYDSALEYLNEKIEDDVVEAVTDKLKDTRNAIVQYFN